jgi:hypothetical protein
MRRAHRFPRRLVRWTSLCICLALVLGSLVILPKPFFIGTIGSALAQSGAQNDKARKVKSDAAKKGAPAGGLPNLEQVKRQRHPEPQAPQHIPSSMRVRRKPPGQGMERKSATRAPRVE